MAVDIKISGVTVSALDDYMITESVGNISSSTITVHVTSGVPQPMQKVEFYIGAVKYFTGLIEDVSSPTWNSKHTVADYDLSITSIETILNNRRVTGSWKNKLAHEIVSDLITDYLLDEGLTAGSISVTDKSYDNYNCEGTRLSEVLDELSRDTGASYYINSALAFNFVVPADYPTVTVPDDINEISENIEAYDLVTVQTVIGAQKETEEQAESILSWTGNYWDLQFQVTTITGMTINGEIALHGIKDIDTDPSITFWYEVGSRRITINPAATFLPDDGDLVACLYKGYLNITATETNDTLIAQLQTLNGTSGRIEAVHNDESILTFTDAYNKAVELLAKSGDVTKTVTLKTHSLTASALNNKWVLNLTDAKISGTYYVIARTITRFANEFECTVTLKNKSADLRPGSSLYKSTKSTNTVVNTSTTKPDTVADCVAIARENYIDLSCNKVAQELNNTLKWYRWEIKKSIAGEWSGASVVITDTNSGRYFFDRSIDGYPEASDLAGWSVRVMAVDIYGNDAESYSNVSGIVTTNYGTWIPTAPALSPYASKRDFTVSIAQGHSARQIYGDIVYRAEIKRYDDVDYYKPNLTADPYESEDNYKDGAGYITVTSYIQQRVPLENQATDPQSTSYTYRFTTVNATTGIVGASATVALIASASTAQDIVNKSMDAEKLNVQDLAAVSTVFGSIRSDGIAKDSTNFWNLSDPTSALGYGEEGEMCVGTSASVEPYDPITKPAGYKDNDSFFHFIPQTVGGVLKGLYMKLANFIITAVNSTVTGTFIVLSRLTGKQLLRVSEEDNKLYGLQRQTTYEDIENVTRISGIEEYDTLDITEDNGVIYGVTGDDEKLLAYDTATDTEVAIDCEAGDNFSACQIVADEVVCIGKDTVKGYNLTDSEWVDYYSRNSNNPVTISATSKRYSTGGIQGNLLYLYSNPDGNITTVNLLDNTYTDHFVAINLGQTSVIYDNKLYIPTYKTMAIVDLSDYSYITVPISTVGSFFSTRRTSHRVGDLYYCLRDDGYISVFNLLDNTYIEFQYSTEYAERTVSILYENKLHCIGNNTTFMDVIDLADNTTEQITIRSSPRLYSTANLYGDSIVILPTGTTDIEILNLQTYTTTTKRILNDAISFTASYLLNESIYAFGATAMCVIDLITTSVVATNTIDYSIRYNTYFYNNVLYIPPAFNGTDLDRFYINQNNNYKTALLYNNSNCYAVSTNLVEKIDLSNIIVNQIPLTSMPTPLASCSNSTNVYVVDLASGRIAKIDVSDTVTYTSTTVKIGYQHYYCSGTTMYFTGNGAKVLKLDVTTGTQTEIDLTTVLDNDLTYKVFYLSNYIYIFSQTSAVYFARVPVADFQLSAVEKYFLYNDIGNLRSRFWIDSGTVYLAESKSGYMNKFTGVLLNQQVTRDVQKEIGSGFVERVEASDGSTMLETADGERVIFGVDKNLIAPTATLANRAKDSYPIPTDAVLQYSFDEIKQLPDNPAGTVYLRDNDWTTVDEWYRGHVSITLSTESQKLKVVYDGTRPDIGLSIQRNGLTYNGKFIVGRIKSTVPIVSVHYYNGTVHAKLNTTNQNAYETVFYGYMSSTSNLFILFVNYNQLTAKTCWVDSLYIGDGSYVEPVIDNSYSETHATNYGVIPVDGVCGKAGYFNNSYMIAPRPALGDDITVYFWAKFDALGNQTIVQSRTVAGQGLAVFQTSNIYRLDWRGNQSTFTGYTPPVNTWHHVCMKMNATTKVLKINGELKSTLTGPYGTTANIASTIWSGMSGTGGTLSGNILTGALDGLKVVPRFTTDDEDIGEYKARANLPKFYAKSDLTSIVTLRRSANFTLPTYLDGQKIRIANTHATNTITCTLPTGQTMNGQASFTIIAGKILELELIGSVWIDTNTDYYSTTEQVIGKWIDGKPLYRKVINFGALPNATTKIVAHGISNLDKTIRLYGTATDPNYTLPLPHSTPNGIQYAINLEQSSTSILVTTGYNRTPYTAIVFIEYTKTTD